MKTIKVKRQIWLTGGLYLVLIVFLLSTNPDNLPVWLLVVPPLLVFLSLVNTFHIILTRLRGYRGFQSRTNRLLYSVLLALVPAGTLVLGSIGQLTVKDVAFSFLFLAIIIFYLSRVGVINKS